MKKNPQNVLIILANPEKNSFSSYVAENYLAAAQEAGEKVQLLDLYAPEWKQNFLSFDQEGKPIIDETTLVMQEKVKWANELVFIFPIRWFDMPAILKNWWDNTMSSGFAYRHKAGSLQPHKLLKGKSARMLCNTGGPTWAMKLALFGTWINRKFGRL